MIIFNVLLMCKERNIRMNTLVLRVTSSSFQGLEYEVAGLYLINLRVFSVMILPSPDD
jgi:hypothetical protein